MSARRSRRSRKSTMRKGSSASTLKPRGSASASGLSLPDARARFPALVAVEAEPRKRRGCIERLCDWCSRFTPLAALDGRDGLMLDISGVAHLFEGEAALIEDCRARLAAQGITVAHRRRRQSARRFSAGAVFARENRA